MDTKTPGKYASFEDMQTDLKDIYNQLESEWRSSKDETYTPYQTGQLITLGSLMDNLLNCFDSFIRPLDGIK